MKNLAIIPARRGSKGLKNKNIKDLAGLPLMAHTIIAAKKSELFDEIIVSTDSLDYKNIAIKYGASVPFLRSEINSQDNSSSWDTVKEVINNYSSIGRNFDNIFLLQPTSPLRDNMDIVLSFKLYLEKEADLVVSVCKVDHSPILQNVLPESLSMHNFIKAKDVNSPRQKQDQFFRINGAIYIIKSSHLEDNTLLYNENSFAYIMEKAKSIDIDDKIDFAFAEHLMLSKIKLE